MTKHTDEIGTATERGVEFWKAVAEDHRDAFAEAEAECERLRRGLRLILDSPFGVDPHELREVAAAFLLGGPDGVSNGR